MARLPRFIIVDRPQYLIMRGNICDPVFLADEDYPFYLKKLKQA